MLEDRRMLAAQFQVVHSLNGSDGYYPVAALTQVGSTLLGTTDSGGSAGGGTAFSINASGSGFKVVHPFPGVEGNGPLAELTLGGSTLYGTTAYGGVGHGTIFSMNTDGSGYRVVHTFTGAADDGADPYAGLTLVGSTLYGTSLFGGAANDGAVFSMNIDGSGFQILHSFTGAPDGNQAMAGLKLIGSTLYGTTLYGGSFDYGTVYSINTDGSEYQILHSFTNADGKEPDARLTLSGSTLYGTTIFGGSTGNGTVFAINTDGSGFHVLHDFLGNKDGAIPCAGVTLVGSTLFGTTQNGGQANDGTVFSINTDGSGYNVLHTFTGGTHDGAIPDAPLTLVGSTLFGTAEMGGRANHGVVFSIVTGVELQAPPNVTNATTAGNTKTTSGLVITPNSADSSLVTYFQINNIVGGTLYQSNGVTPIRNGAFITVAQGAAGLKFTPNSGFSGTASFTILESTALRRLASGA